MFNLRDCCTLVIAITVTMLASCGADSLSLRKKDTPPKQADIDPSALTDEERQYLFTRNEGIALFSGSLADPQPVTQNFVDQVFSQFSRPAAGFAVLDNRFSDFFDATMQEVDPAGARKIRFEIEEKDYINAASFGPLIKIFQGTFELEEDAFLSAVCHELAHSLRYHSWKFSSLIASNEGVNREALQSFELLFEDTFNKMVQVNSDGTFNYTHDAARLKELLNLREAAEGGKYAKKRKFESEADIIGARFCAEMGMPFALYQESLSTSLREAVGDAEDGDALVDGETIENIPGDEEAARKILENMVSPRSHPTNDERSEQLERISNSSLEAAERDLYDEWIEMYPDARAMVQQLELWHHSLAGTSFAMTDSPKRRLPKAQHRCSWDHGIN